MKKILLLATLLYSLGATAQPHYITDLLPYRSGDKWGYCDKNKNVVIAPVFKSVGPLARVWGQGLSVANSCLNKSAGLQPEFPAHSRDQI